MLKSLIQLVVVGLFPFLTHGQYAIDGNYDNVVYLRDSDQHEIKGNYINTCFMIQNDTYIIGNSTFENCHFRFSPSAKLIVKSSVAVSSTNSTYENAAAYMWQGIELEADSRWGGRFDTYRQAIV
ncbi:MAG: hypothetical protein ACK4K0_11745, partial [Flavobacteriales bacterium]